LNSRERGIRAIEHEEPDRVPLEGVAWAEWSFPFLQKVLAYLGLPPVTRGGMLGAGEELEAFLKRIGADFRAVSMEPPEEFRRKAIYDPLFHQPWGIRVGPDTLEDEWGIRRQLNATKTQSRIIYHPLKNVEDFDEYDFPDINAPGRFDSAEKLVRKWRNDYLISGIWGGDSFFCQAWYLRGFKELINDMYSNPKLVEKLFDKLLEFFLAATKRLIEIGIDILAIADDIAAQTGMIVSPMLWRKYIKPRLKSIVYEAKKKGVYVLYHTDGNCTAIIQDLIEIGIDILNPIQPECMNPAEVKKLYGEELTLSGTISIQDTLPYGSVEDVKKEVLTRIETCAYGGGLILSPSNQVLLDGKVENFLAVYDAVKKYGRYPLCKFTV
jgi:uroporphyrinogen decarboxylase